MYFLSVLSSSSDDRDVSADSNFDERLERKYLQRVGEDGTQRRIQFQHGETSRAFDCTCAEGRCVMVQVICACVCSCVHLCLVLLEDFDLMIDFRY